jgi:hypothetical protein
MDHPTRDSYTKAVVGPEERIGDDLALYAMLRNVRPTEEIRRIQARSTRKQSPE